jgi:hypothetical protein
VPELVSGTNGGLTACTYEGPGTAPAATLNVKRVSFTKVRASRIARPPRAARSASLSCASGLAKERPSGPSPRYLATWSPNRVILISGPLITGDRLAPFVGVEMRGDLARPNLVAKQHRHMAPLR